MHFGLFYAFAKHQGRTTWATIATKVAFAGKFCLHLQDTFIWLVQSNFLLIYGERLVVNQAGYKCSFDSTLVDEFLTYGEMLIALVSIHFWCFTYFLRCSIHGKHDRDTNGIFQSKFHLISYKSFCSHSWELETGINHSGCSNKFFWGEKMLIFSAEHPDQILAVYRI